MRQFVALQSEFYSNVEIRICLNHQDEQTTARVSDNQQAMTATVQEETVDCCTSADCEVPIDSCEMIWKKNCCVC